MPLFTTLLELLWTHRATCILPIRATIASPKSHPPASLVRLPAMAAGTPANGAFSGDGGPAIDASLNNPTAIAVDGMWVVYFADQFNQRIRKVALDGPRRPVSTFLEA